MSVARVTEIISSSKVSCDSHGHILEYRVILKVTFVLED